MSSAESLAYPRDVNLTDRVALVTGGGRGIGAAIARSLAEADARVAVLARSAEEVRLVAREVGGLAVTADVAEPADVRRAIAEVEKVLGAVDVLVVNAGVVWPLGQLLTTHPDEWERAIAINLLGAVRCVREVLPGMVDRGWGRVVAVSSGAADPPGLPSASAYSVGKAGLDMFVVNLAPELTGSGVTVNGVRPGTADTGMQDYMRSLSREQVGAEFHDRFHGLHREGRLVPPEVAGRLVARLVGTERNGEILDARALDDLGGA